MTQGDGDSKDFPETGRSHPLAGRALSVATSDALAECLATDLAIAEQVVLCRETPTGRVRLAFVIPEGPFDPRSFFEKLSERLDPELLPDAWIPLQSIPRRDDGTIDLEALTRVPIFGEDRREACERRLHEHPEVAEAAVEWVEDTLPPPPLLHLDDLIPDRRAALGAAADRVPEDLSLLQAEASDSAGATATVPAIVHGGEPCLDEVPPDLPGLLRRAAETAPQKGILYLAIGEGEEGFQTYSELLREAEQLLAGLRLQGLRAGDKVLFQLERRRDLIPALWACLLGGIVPLPAAVPASFDPGGSPVGRLLNAWRLLEAPLILTDSQHHEPLRRLIPEPATLSLVSIDELRKIDLEGPVEHHRAELDDLALLFMTSGSTGKPKLVQHTHRSLLSREVAAVEAVGWSRDDISLNWLSLDHVASLADFHLRDVFLGCQQIQAPTAQVLEDPLRWLDWIDHYRVSITWAPSFAYGLLAERLSGVEDRRWDLSCLRCALNGGEAIVARTARACLQALLPHGLPEDALQPVWGMAETASGATYSHLRLEETSDDDPFVEVGGPVPGISLRIVDDSLRVVDEGTVGQLQVKGPIVTTGYYRRPELDREVFTHDGWFRTGDLAILRQGRLTLTGRESDVVIVHGLNHYSHEIESVVEEIPGVQPSFTAACGVRLPGDETDHLALFFHTPIRDPGDLRRLLAEIRDRVLQRTGLHPTHLLPLSREEIPKTGIGKIQRSVLKRRFEAGELADARKRVELLTGGANTLPGWFYERLWKRREIVAGGDRPRLRRVLVLVDRHGLGDRLLSTLGAFELDLVRVESGSSYSRGAAGFRIRPAEPADVRRLLAEVESQAGPVDGIVDLRSFGPVADDDPEPGDFLALVQGLAAAEGDAAQRFLWVVSSRSQTIDPQQPARPERSLWPVLTQAAGRDVPGLHGRHLDLPAEAVDDLPAAASWVLTELRARDADPEIAYRNGHRLAPALRPCSFAGDGRPAPLFRDGGVILLTGGLGGIGTTVARHLLQRHGARLLLVGRSPLSPDDDARRARFDELRALPGEVAYLAADVTRAETFLPAVREALARWDRPLDGVLHLAGSFHQASLTEESAAGLESIIAPKLAGSRTLARLIAGTDSFFVGFSSISSHFGGATIGAYSAANRAQETFCRELARQHSGPVICCSWSLWDEIGMSEGNPQKTLLQARGYELLSGPQGIDSLLAALASGHAELLIGLDGSHRHVARQVLAEPRPLRRPRGFYALAHESSADLDPLLRELPFELSVLPELPHTDDGAIDRQRLVELGRDASDTPRRPANELEQRLATLFQDALGVAAVGLGDNFFQLGGHSILATQMLSRLREELGANVSTVQFLEGPTVAQLAERVAELAAEKASGREGDSAPAGPSLRLVPAPEKRFEPFPLTEIQQAYWIGESSDLELGAVSMHLYQEIDGDGLEPARLGAAWNRLVQRHDMLRVVILPDGRGQVFETVAPYEIETLDLRELDPAAEAEALAATREEMSHQRFRLGDWPGFEIRVSLRPGGATRVHLSTSLVHLDGGSFYLLMSEWGTLYHDLDAELPALEHTYADYARAVRAQQETDAYQASAEYWQGRLPSLPPAPALPLAGSLAALESYRFVPRRQQIPAPTWKVVERLAQKKGLSRSAVLLTAYAAVLDTWSEGTGLSLNVTLFQRPAEPPGLRDVVGDFTSTVLVGIEPDPGDHFESLARRVQERLWSDLEHRRVSGVAVLRELGRQHDEHSSALMPYVFTSALDLDMRGATSPGSALRRLGTNHFHVSQTPQVLLDFLTYEEDGDLVLIWDAVDVAFPPGLLDAMFTTLGRLLEDLAYEEQWQQPPRLVPEGQLVQRQEVNATEAPRRPERLHTLFHHQAALRPEHPAVIADGTTLTYGELEERALRVAAWLFRRGARPNTLVAVVMAKGWQQVVGTLGILRSGAAYLPIDPEQPKDRRFYLLDNGRVDLVLTTAALDAELEWPEGLTRLAVDSEIPARAADAPAEPVQGTEDLAYVIFTSGSTGQPKGVKIDHRGAVNTVVDINRRFDVGPEDRVLALSALNFDLSVYDLFGLLAAGGTLVMPEATATRDPRRWLELLREHRVSLWNSVPALMEMTVDLAASRGEDLGPDLRHVLLSGDWIPTALPDHIRRLAPNARVTSLGGATEASIWSILYPIDTVPPEWASIPYGRPMENQTWHVLDRALRPVPVWVPGELYIGGIGVALGYWRDEAKTAASFVVHPETGERLYRTGDLGRYLPDGNLEFLGRRDNQVKIHGHRIELGEIEVVLAEHPAVSTAVVLAVGERPQDRRLAAWFLPAEGLSPEPETLRHHLEQKLPHYMVPAAFVELTELPLSATGKVDRKALLRQIPDLDLESGSRASEYVEPRNPTEAALVELWQELLDLDRIGIHDDLLLLGGDSLKAILAIARLRDQFRVEVPLRSLLGGHPTVADLATSIHQLRDRGTVSIEGLPRVEPAPADRHRPFPLHAIQEAYWIGRRDAFELGNVAAYFYLETELPELDLDRLTAAWQRVIERHDMLRAVVESDGRQRILEQTPDYEIAALDLSTAGEAEAETELASIRERMSQQVLAADCWPLFELRVTRLPDGRYRIHFGLDLLISDAWSVQILFGDLERFYYRPDQPSPPLELTYRDYLLAESRLEDSERVRRSRDYWWQRLDRLPPAPQLPLVKEPSEIVDPVFVRRRATLERNEWQSLKEHASRHGITPSGLLLTVFAEVLALWSREPRFVLNVTTFNRLPLHPQVEDIVGDFTSLTLLEIDARTGSHLVERAERLQSQLWEDLEHRYVSGVRVLRELARRQGRNPGALAPIVFTSLLARHGDGDTSFLPLGSELVYATSQTPQVWLDHQVLELDGGLAFTWDVVDELLPPGLLDDLFATYVTLLRDLASDESRWRHPHPAHLPAAQLAEREQVNTTAAPLPTELLHQPIFQHAAREPDRLAVVSATRTLTYQELDQRSGAAARWLLRHHARPDTLVAVVMEKGWEQAVATLAVLRAGAAYLPIAADLPAARRDFLLRHGQVELVLTQRRWIERLEWPEGLELLALDDEPTDLDETETPDSPALDLENLAYVIFTSGSTGTPKGVIIDHRGARNTIADINRRFRVGPDDRALALSALNFDLSVYDLFGLLAAGGAVVMPDPEALRDPAAWLELLESEQVTVWNSVPALLEMLVEYLEPRDRQLPASLRLVLLSGDWIPVALPDRLRALSPAPETLEIVSLGGATEASIWSICHPVEAADRERVSIPYGRPLDNQRFHVLDTALEPRPTWVPGELYIGGAGVALGYWRDPERTADQFLAHPRTGERLYRTGDLGRYLPGGEIEFLGREDNQVKIQGHRIELGEIEAVLDEHPAVGRAVAVVATAGSARRIFAFFAVTEGASAPGSEELCQRAAERLPDYMVPAACHPLDSLPLTTNGKVDRKALVALAESAAEAPGADSTLPEAPRTALEEQLVELWREMLQIETLGVSDALFDLGGNSLLAIRLLARVRELFGLDISLRNLLENPTVAGLAGQIEAQRAAGGDPADEQLPALIPDPARRHQPFPLNEVQQAYWLGRMESMELGNVAAHFYFELELETPHPENIQAAWRRLVARHDMLRTVFLPDGEQRVLETVPDLVLPRLELADVTAEEAERSLAAVRQELSHQVLPTDRWPLFDIRLSLLGGERVRLHFSFDLLIADAWSARLLFQEFASLYRQPDLEMAPLELTFRDYVTATTALPETAAYRRAETYWNERLPDLPAAPQLPLAKDPATLETPRFRRRSGRLPAELWERLKERASGSELTPSGLLLAVYAEVLAAWSASPRFTLNVTTFNRFPIHPQINDVIGDFTSLTLLAVDGEAAAADTFEARARWVQKQLWADLDHRHVSGVQVLRDLARLQGRAPGALMPVVFTSRLFHGAESGESFLDITGGEVVYAVSQTPQVWLDKQVDDDGGDLVWTWDAVEDLFPPGLLDDMFAAYGQLLETLARDESSWRQRRFELLPEAHRELAAEANSTAAPVTETTLHKVFLDRAEAPAANERPAVIAADRELTYGQLAAESARVAAWLQARDARANRLVAIVMDKGWEQAVAALGVVRSGAAYLPIDPEWPAQRRDYLLANGEVELVLTQPHHLETEDWPEDVELLALSAETIAELPERALDERSGPSDLAYVIFTSGSTGEPKGVAIEHRSAVNTVLDVNRRFRLQPEDRLFGLSALTFDLSVWDLFGAFAAGAALVLPPPEARRDPSLQAPLLSRHRVTVWNSVPALLELLLEHLDSHPEAAPETLRLTLLSGDWLPLDIGERLRRHVPAAELYSLGGATEASIWSILYPVGDVDPSWPSIPYGKALTNQTFHVLDDELRQRPVWVPGALYIGGIGLAREYWRDEAKTRGSFVVDPESGRRLYRTGDLGRLLPDGNLEFLGRSDAQVKVQGYRIELGEIEAALQRQPSISTAVVTAPEAPRAAGGRGSRRLVAYVVPAESGESLDLEALQKDLGEILPHYMVPGLFVELAALPLTSNGKVDRGRLEAEALAHQVPGDSTAGTMPRTPTEERLCGLWQELLAVETVGIHDNLFDLGGNSLLAIQLSNRIRDTFEVEVSLQELFREPTVAHLAAEIARLRARHGTAAPEALPTLVADLARRDEPFPLNEVQQAYWVGRMEGIELGNVAAHSYTEVENVDFDLAAFDRALQHMIRRHDALRTIIQPDGQQKILPEVPVYEIAVLDLRGRSQAEVEAAIAGLRAELSHQVLATDRWPIFEIRATRLDGDRTRLHLSFDLLISDAWSSQILFRELAQVAADPELELPPLEISFRDYVLAEKGLEGTELHRRSMEYWQRRLPEMPPAPELPMLAGADLGAAPRFVRRTDRLDVATWQRLQELGTEAGLTPSGLLLAAFSEVLAHWSKSPRFTLNLTTFNRLPLHEQVNDLMGDFTSLTLLTADLSGREAFTIEARRLQEQLWADLDHRYVNGVTVMRELARIQGRPAAALMPIVFTSRLFRDGRFGEVADLRYGEVVYSVSQTPQVWLDHQVVDEADGLVWTWDVVDDLFPAGLVDDLFRAYGALLRRLAAEPECWQSPVRPLLTPAEQVEVRSAVNRTAAPVSDELLHTLFLRQVEARRDQAAVVDPRRTLTYGELADAAWRIARWLRQKDARPETLVAVVMEKGWEQVAAVLGTLCSGAAYLPIDPGLPAERLAYLLDRGRVELVLTQSWLDGQIDWPDEPGIERLAVDAAAFDTSLDSGPLDIVQGPDDLAYVIFTSGSTGRPKGVSITHRGAVNTVLDVNRRFAVGPEDRVFALSALNFDLSVYDIFGLLAAGGALVLPAPGSERDPVSWAKLLQRHRVSLWSSVPTLMEMLVEADGSASSGSNGAATNGAGGNGAGARTTESPGLPESLRLVLLSGDWIPLSLPPKIRARRPEARVISLGGATEASIWSILFPVEEVDPEWKSIPYGKPMANQTWHVLDEGLVPRPEHVPGELYIGGIGLARDYWRDEEKTAAAFRIHPETGERLYRTGDMGRALPDGSIEFLGREDLQVKVQGYRIELGEIEAALAEHPAIASAVVTAPPVPGGDERSRRLVGYAVPAESGTHGSHPVESPPELPTFEAITDPLERLQFKLARKGLRRDLDDRPAVGLPGPALDDHLLATFARRRSHRRFATGPIPRDAFGRWLACLRQIQPEGVALPKARYPSGGGLYPVQAYLQLRAGAVEGLEGGLYAYHPSHHQLLFLGPAEIDPAAHGPENRGIVEGAAFSLFLVSRLAAIAPLYPQTARDFCLLEAGYMGQLLMDEAAGEQLGLCPLGGQDFATLRPRLGIDPWDELVHSFAGGALEDQEISLLEALQEESGPPPRMETDGEAATPSKTSSKTGATGDTSATVWSGEALEDPVARLEFKLRRHGLPEAGGPRVDLPAPPLDPALLETYAERRSCRHYLEEEISLEELGGWLSCLRSLQPEGLPLPKYRYPSGGGLYPVQAYLHVEPGRVSGLAGGTYLYDPREHRLVQLHAATRIDPGVHGEGNRPIAERAAFSLFLVGDQSAVAPLYSGLARDFCLLEAGYMSQLLMSEGPAHRIGTVPLGGLDFDTVRPLLDLGPEHQLVHLLVGGRIPAETPSLADAETQDVSAPAPAAHRSAPVPVAVTPGAGVSGVSAEDLRTFLADKLPSYMVPPTITILEAWPLTANGKVDRRALPLPEASIPAATPAAAPVAPRSELEHRLAALVRELLSLEQVGIHDNLFELGATSVQIIQLQLKIRQELGRELAITDLFRHPNVLALAEALAGDGAEETVELGQEQARRRKAAARKRRRRKKTGKGEDR